MINATKADGIFLFLIMVLGGLAVLSTEIVSSPTPILQHVFAISSTATMLTSNANPSAYGQPVTFTATVTSSGVTPTGTVTFKDGTSTLGTSTLGSGTAIFITSSLIAGIHSITASYAGDSNSSPSNSTTLIQIVNKSDTTTIVTSSVNPSAFGQSVKFTATVKNSGKTPSGTVTFKDGTTTLGTGTLSSGKATFTTSTLAISIHSITALYAGNSNFNPSTSPTLVQTVNPDTIPPVITLKGSNPVTLQLGSTYFDAGATAIDNVDGDISSSIIISNPVNTSILGTYLVTYNVKDTAGNAATQVTRTVNVTNTGAPIIYMQDTTASYGLSTYLGRQIHAEYVTGSSALVGKQIGTIMIQLKRVGAPTGNATIGVFNTDLSVKRSFASIDVSTIPISYTNYAFSLPYSAQPYQIQAGDEIGIKYTGGDVANYVAIMTDQSSSNPFDGTNTYHTYYDTTWNTFTNEDLYMTLELPDTIPPVITLRGSNPVSVQVGSTYFDAGATATDNVDGDLTSSIITSNQVNTAIVGAYTVTYNVSDKAGNASTQVTRTVNVVSPNIRLDSFGVQQFYAQKAGKQSIVLGLDNPNTKSGFVLDGNGSAVAHTQGQFNYYTIQPRVGGLSGSATQLTMRINLNPVLSSGTQVDWMTAEQQGYMVVPADIDEFEQTGYFRIKNITSDDDITFKQGGQHADSNPTLAGSFGTRVMYSGNYGTTSDKELNFTDYEFFSDKVFLNAGSIVDKWIGVKEISRHTSNGQLYDVYVDLEPINFATGKPNNNWQHLFSHLDDGKEAGIYAGHVTLWGKKYFTYRIDEAQNIDFALLSVYHIDPTTGQNIPDVTPSAPQNLQATAGVGSVALSWQAPSSNGGSPITNYKIYRSTSSGTEVLYVTLGNVNSYTNTGLVWGTTYFYKVSAVNSAGTSPLSNEASARPPTVPFTPQNLQATAGVGSIALTWYPPSSNGGFPITKYLLYRSTSSGTETYLTTLGNVTSYTNTGLTNNITYFYEVRAVNSAGASPYSNEASTTLS